jgi:hypothetical protein
MDQVPFPIDLDWTMVPDTLQGAPIAQNPPVQYIDPTKLLLPQLRALESYLSTTATVPNPTNVSPGDPSSLVTPSVLSSLSSSAGHASELASPLYPLVDSPLGALGDIPDHVFETGYPDGIPHAVERRDILRRLIFREATGQQICTRDVKKLANDFPADPNGKRLHCAWTGCTHACSRPDRFKTHVFTHIKFKPFPCDRTCGEPHW